MIRAVARAAVAAVTLALGCAKAPQTPGDLLVARATLTEARRSARAGETLEVLAEAGASLARAERDQLRDPGSLEAFDSAYVARRDAERARVEGAYVADRAALAAVRADVARRGTQVDQREVRERVQREQRAAQRLALEGRREARREALVRAGRGAIVLTRDAASAVLRIPVEEVFWPGTAVIRYGTGPRLAAIAEAIRGGPPCSVTLEVLDDAETKDSAGWALAKRRRARLCAALVGHGVRADVFEPAARRPGRGTQIDIVITERPRAGATEVPAQ